MDQSATRIVSLNGGELSTEEEASTSSSSFSSSAGHPITTSNTLLPHRTIVATVIFSTTIQ